MDRPTGQKAYRAARDLLVRHRDDYDAAVAAFRWPDVGDRQARANLRSEEVNLGHTVIKSPIDGIVISRNVDPGQTVASSMNAPEWLGSIDAGQSRA